jgi:hypothetical protein
MAPASERPAVASGEGPAVPLTAGGDAVGESTRDEAGRLEVFTAESSVIYK